MKRPFQFNLKNSVSAQLLRVVFSFYLILTVVVTFIHMSTEFADTKRQVRRELEIIGNTFAPGLAKALWDINLEQLKPTFLGMVHFPAVEGVVLINERDEVVGAAGIIESTRGQVQRIADDGSWITLKGYAGLFHYSFPIIYDSYGKRHAVGTATIYSSAGVVFNKVKLGFFFIIINAIIKTIAFWFLFLWISDSFLHRPLTRLTDKIRQLDPHQLSSFQDQPMITQDNELKQLEDSFGIMVANLDAAHKELLELNTNLEQKVQVRTAKLAEMNRKLHHLAHYDTLTELMNRRAFVRLLRREFLRMKRSGQRYVLIMIDIDHFKTINDSYGHNVGDQVLKEVAQLISGAIRESDYTARIGGEEFVVLLPNTTDGGESVAEKIRAAVADALIPVVNHVTISLGLTVVEYADAQEDDALKQADQALYAAKAQGRNCVVLFG